MRFSKYYVASCLIYLAERYIWIKMTKLQILNAFMTERLMVAVQEILAVVGNTVSEYQQETARIKRENESLKWKLHEVGLEPETTSERTQQAAFLVSGGKSLTEQQHCEQECSSNLRQDTALTLTEEKREITEGHQIRQRDKDPVCILITNPTQPKHQLCMSEDSVINCRVTAMNVDVALLVHSLRMICVMRHSPLPSLRIIGLIFCYQTAWEAEKLSIP
ncbi:hypothetical protein SKAU_G00131980 [Synaphobranchus kaupii]|uniref:Uncharacterized protein n=1 Tax=Synaphobranchus kaupii TaxID=118154 RepID=A0A9Q1J1A5_SYNKA|nr:hypothetical protein SKAU_G00131980 [Synaphobranchus kaupii]